ARPGWMCHPAFPANLVCSLIDGGSRRIISLEALVKPPLNPIVLVTSSDRENACCLMDLTVEEVVWTDELEAQLLVAVKRAEGTGLLEATASTVEQCDHLPPKLREALALVCRSWPPMRSVAQLARAVPPDRS